MVDLHALQDRLRDIAGGGGVAAGTVLEWDLVEAPAEAGIASPLAKLQANLARTLDLRTAIRALDRAAADDRVAGLVARIDLTGAPLATCQELRAAIARFRAAGKATAAWSETIPGVGALCVASAFERVTVLAAGEVAIVGLGTSTTFLGEALPRAGVEPEFLQRHEYKNMANLFTETDFTPPHREAVEALQSSALGQLVADIATGRDLDPDAVLAAIESGPHSAADAVELGLIDATGFQDEVWDAVAPDDTPLQYLERYHHHSDPKPAGLAGLVAARTKPKTPVVAVVPVTGTIASGRSGGLKPGLPPGPGTGADTFVAAVRAAVADDDVAAVVVRIDSPGGSAVASEVMARAIDVGRAAGTPFVASMGSVAASGGYYVAAPCDRIVANPGTVTGSIGVVAGKFVTAGLREKAHLATRVLQTSENASLLSSLSPWSEEQRAVLDAQLDRIYEVFLDRVATGRGMARDEVHEVARGRVWTGADAQARGLVDVLGGFTEALAEARSLAGLAADAEVEVVGFPKSSPLDVLRKPESSRPAAGISLPGLDLVSLALDPLLVAVGTRIAGLVDDPTGAAVQARLTGDWQAR